MDTVRCCRPATHCQCKPELLKSVIRPWDCAECYCKRNTWCCAKQGGRTNGTEIRASNRTKQLNSNLGNKCRLQCYTVRQCSNTICLAVGNVDSPVTSSMRGSQPSGPVFFGLPAWLLSGVLPVVPGVFPVVPGVLPVASGILPVASGILPVVSWSILAASADWS